MDTNFVPTSWLVVGPHELRSAMQRPANWQVTLIQCPDQLLRPRTEDAQTYTMPMQDWPAMPTRTVDQDGTVLGRSVRNLAELLAGYRDVPLGLLRPSGPERFRLYPHVDSYQGCTRYLRMPNEPVGTTGAPAELLRVIDEHFLRVNNYLCYRVKLEPDVELEHKFSFTGNPDIHVLARQTLAAADQDAFPGWIVEFREEIQQWDFLNHIYAISAPEQDVGYVSFIPTTDGRYTVKRKIFSTDTDERPELRSKGIEVGADRAAHVRDVLGLTPDWNASFRRIRYDVSVEHVRSGNVFGIAFDRSTVIDEDGVRIESRPELVQCEIEYIYSQSITPLGFDSVRADLADLRVSVADWFRSRGLHFYETHESKLTWLRNQHVLAH